jgi:murein DD-endopeptidase MepM/ murein hydrolase activator NlpD
MSRAHWVVLFASTSLFSVVFFLISDIAEATRIGGLHTTDLDISKSSIRMVNLPLELPTLEDYFGSSNSEATQDEVTAKPIAKPINRLVAPKMKWQTITVKKGDNVSKLFSRMEINPKELHKIVRLGDQTKTLNLISPGEEIKFLVINDKLQELIYEFDHNKSLHILRNEGDEFTASTITTELDKRIAHATAEIESSLFVAAQEAGIPGSMTMELANIFDWDIDFVLDVRTGDRFSVIYEEYYVDGKKISNGNILAAEFVNNGKVYRTVRYQDTNGHFDYYTPDGKSVRKAFLRNPLDFTRISSTFGKRYHPILNRMRAHNGVDYVAPSGTPIKAAGDGEVAHVGRKGGYGNTVIIQHGGKYSTLYAHLKAFKKGLRVGDRVTQGDIIGYVGKSGLATGTHLHYEFQVDGIHRNPLTVKLPGAQPITRAQKLAFKLNTQGYLTMLDTLGKTVVSRTTTADTDDNRT